MATTNHSEKQEDQSTQPVGFGFGTSNDSHEIEASYSWRYVDRIYIDEGTVVRSQDTDGYYNNDESFECTCGEEFACKSDAEGHLCEERVRGPPVPTADQPRELSWQAESETGFGGRVDQRQNLLLQCTANKLDLARVSLVVDYPSLGQFWEMGMVKGDSDALSMFVGYSIDVFVPNPICNAIDERIEV